LFRETNSDNLIGSLFNLKFFDDLNIQQIA
jgi:hypothetical protein